MEFISNHQMAFVFCIIIVAAGMMASNRFRFDFIALLVVLTLILTDILTVSEALSGFGNYLVILIAGLLVIGEMLDRTGVARAVGDRVLHYGGKSENKLIALFMISAAGLSAVMSSTAVVAIFLPIVLRVAAQTGISASKLLIPMSYGALISGMLTLIATPPNLALSAELVSSGYSPLSFFSFTLIGLVVLFVAVLYIIYIGKRHLPNHTSNTSTTPYARTVKEIWQDFQMGRESIPIQITANSPLVGQTLGTCGLHSQYGLRILCVDRIQGGKVEQFIAPSAQFPLHAGDILLAIGPNTLVEEMMATLKLIPYQASKKDQKRWENELGAVTVLIHPNSRLIGKTLHEIRFYHRYFLDVVGIRRQHTSIESFPDKKLQASDSLFIIGPWKQIENLQAQNHDFVVLEMPTEYQNRVPAFHRLPIAMIILFSMITLSLLDLMPLVTVVLIAAIAGVSTGCLTANDAYRSIQWNSLVLVAGMLPLADALTKTGGADTLVALLSSITGDASPMLMMSLLFCLTTALTLVLSNTASAVLMGPITIKAAEILNVSPYPLIITVLIAASCAFATPMASTVVTLTVEPGRYRFMDFVKLGLPLTVIVFIITMLLTPRLFPF